MAKVIFTQGAIAQQLADTGWADMKAHLSTKPCTGGGAHAVGDTYGGGFGEITGTGYTPQTASEPAANSSGTKTWPTVSFSTGTAADWPAAVKSVVYTDLANTKLIYAEDLSATRDMSAAYRTITHTLTTTSAVS
jgi:hypothetical protein